MKRFRMLVQVAVEVDAHDLSESWTCATLALGVNDGMFTPSNRIAKPLRETVSINGKTVPVNATYTYTDVHMIHEVAPYEPTQVAQDADEPQEGAPEAS